MVLFNNLTFSHSMFSEKKSYMRSIFSWFRYLLKLLKEISCDGDVL